MKIWISHRISSSKKIKATKKKIEAKILTEGELSRFKDTTYQFKEEIGGVKYRFYSKPGKEQYTWDWFAVPY